MSVTFQTIADSWQEAKGAAVGAPASVVTAINAAIAEAQAAEGPAYPAWRRGLPVGLWYALPGTAQVSGYEWPAPQQGGSTQGIIDNWNGAFRYRSPGSSVRNMLGLGLAAGHLTWQTSKVAIDLFADSPAFREIHPGSQWKDVPPPYLLYPNSQCGPYGPPPAGKFQLVSSAQFKVKGADARSSFPNGRGLSFQHAGGYTEAGKVNGVPTYDGADTLVPFSGVTITAPISAVGVQYYPTYYCDGRPASPHSEWSLHDVDAANSHDGNQRIMRLGDMSLWPGGNGTSMNVNGFRVDLNEWEPKGTFSALPRLPTSGQWVPMAQDPVTQDVYMTLQNAFVYKWVAKTAKTVLVASYQTLTGLQSNWPFAFVRDVKRDRLAYLSNYGGTNHLHCVDGLSTGTLSVTNIPLTGVPAGFSVGGQPGFVHDTHNDVYVAQNTNGVFAKIDPDTGVCSSMPNLPAAPNGIYHRLQYWDELGGIFSLPRYSLPLYFMPTR